MTTSAAAFLTRLRAWALVAGLTGLVIALGAMIGGAFLWLFAALAVVFNLVGYFYSDRIALRVARAQPLSEYFADATAAQLLGRAAPLAEALEEIERNSNTALQVNPMTAPMYIANPLSRGQMSALFSTHPPIKERVRRLRAYDRAAAEPTVERRQSASAKPLAAGGDDL
jgi:heat shock protein HtpX